MNIHDSRAPRPHGPKPNGQNPDRSIHPGSGRRKTREFPRGRQADADSVEEVRALLGDRFVTEKPRMIAEDFAYYQLSVPGVFVFCGCMDENHKSPLHADTFDFDERALITGLALFIGLTARKDKENGLV